MASNSLWATDRVTQQRQMLINCPSIASSKANPTASDHLRVSVNDKMAPTSTTQTLSSKVHDEQPIVSFHFISDLTRYEEEKLFEIWQETGPNVPKSNCEFEKLDGIKLESMRTADIRLDYDTTGFKYLHAPSMAALRGVDCVENEESPRLDQYLDEIISLIKVQFSTEQVICFDWRVS